MTKDEWKHITDALKAPFEPNQVSWRVQGKSADGKPQALAYIDARNVMDRLDEVCGTENWTYDWEPVVIEGGQVKVAKGKLSLFGLPPKCDIGDSGSIEANKSAISDALKRAAVHWGVGRYLYELEAEPVVLTNGKIGAQELKRLQALLTGEKPTESQHTIESLRERAAKLGWIGAAYNKLVCEATNKNAKQLIKNGVFSPTPADLEKIDTRIRLLEKDAENHAKRAHLNAIAAEHESEEDAHLIPDEQLDEALEAQAEAATEQPANDQQLQSIRKLCAALGREEPAQSVLTFTGAAALIRQLSREYNTQRRAS